MISSEQQEPSMRENSLTDSLVFIYVTTFCNLRCRHCYIGDRLDSPEHMAPSDLYAFLRYARTIGFWQVEFLGGEPLMYPHLDGAFEEAMRLGFKIFVSTNGTIPPRTKHRIDYLSISLDQVEDDEDGMRPGLSFSRFIHNIPRLKAITRHLSATITLSQRNVKHLERLLDFCTEQEFDTALIHYFTPLGAGAESHDMIIPPDKYIEITEWIETNAALYPFLIRYQKKYLPRANARECAKLLGLRYLGNRSRILGEGLAVFPDLSVHIDPLFFDKEPLGWFDGTGIRFNIASRELDALFRVPTACLSCKDAALCGGPDSASIAYPEQHLVHSKCDEQYIPIETTWTVNA